METSPSPETVLARLAAHPAFTGAKSRTLLDELSEFLRTANTPIATQTTELILTAISNVLSAPTTPAPIILLDVDGVVNIIEQDLPIRPGLHLLLRALTILSASTILWSGAGAQHAEAEATRGQLTNHVTAYLDKPDYPMIASEAYALLPYAPVLQVDDDVTEHVLPWPFLQLPMLPYSS